METVQEKKMLGQNKTNKIPKKSRNSFCKMPSSWNGETQLNADEDLYPEVLGAPSEERPITFRMKGLVTGCRWSKSWFRTMFYSHIYGAYKEFLMIWKHASDLLSERSRIKLYVWDLHYWQSTDQKAGRKQASG